MGEGATTTTMAEALFCFGIIADIQYADLEDGYDYHRTQKRYYRHSLCHLQKAIEDWNRTKIQFVLQLGDIIDGFNAQYKTSEKALEQVMMVFQELRAPVHHVWGNHELYNFRREHLVLSALNTKYLEDHTLISHFNMDQSSTGDMASEFYYAYQFCPMPPFRFIILDTYDLSTLGRDTCSKKYQDSLQLLKRKNQNVNLNSPLDLDECQFVQFNGGFSQDQLDWLDKVLTYADENKERVVIAGHIPIHPNATNSVCLAWNYEAALSVLHSHHCVVCFLAGHLHYGGYCLDSHGIHHLTLEGIIATHPQSNAFGTIYVYEDRLVLKGSGSVLDQEMLYQTDRDNSF